MGAAANASRSGDLLNDRYELCELVESHETDQLYSARDTETDRLVHIALLRAEHALRPGVAQRFVSRPTQLARLDHPNVVRVWSVESDDSGIPFVVHEPRSGPSLSTMLDAFPDGMPLGVAVNLLVPIVEAMAAAHGRRLTHGALDSEHIVLAELAGATSPKIFGFGSDPTADASDDVRALGALFYRALSGQQDNTRRHTPLDEVAPHLPLELTELVERCLASVDERPADARLLCDELQTLRQRLGGNRASAVSTERAAVHAPSPVPVQPRPAATPAVARPQAVQPRISSMPAIAAKACVPAPASAPAYAPVAAPAKDEDRRRRAIERAETEPIPELMEPVVESKIDPHGATCFDSVPPPAEAESDAEQALGDPATDQTFASPSASTAPSAVASAPAPADLEQSSIDFPMASARPGSAQQASQ